MSKDSFSFDIPVLEYFDDNSLNLSAIKKFDFLNTNERSLLLLCVDVVHLIKNMKFEKSFFSRFSQLIKCNTKGMVQMIKVIDILLSTVQTSSYTRIVRNET